MNEKSSQLCCKDLLRKRVCVCVCVCARERQSVYLCVLESRAIDVHVFMSLGECAFLCEFVPGVCGCACVCVYVKVCGSAC